MIFMLKCTLLSNSLTCFQKDFSRQRGKKLDLVVKNFIFLFNFDYFIDFLQFPHFVSSTVKFVCKIQDLSAILGHRSQNGKISFDPLTFTYIFLRKNQKNPWVSGRASFLKMY